MGDSNYRREMWKGWNNYGKKDAYIITPTLKFILQIHPSNLINLTGLRQRSIKQREEDDPITIEEEEEEEEEQFRGISTIQNKLELICPIIY